MTRIISGTARGRQISVPPTGTRPTSDRVREAIFNSLQHRLGGFYDVFAVDLFAGSGALALEALSRGATKAIAVDDNTRAIETIKKNAATLNFGLVTAKNDVFSWVSHYAGEAADVIFIDPPYELESQRISELLQALDASSLTAADTVVVVERSTRSEDFLVPEGVELVDDRHHGETRVVTLVW
jgi:16S rRNA (guanine966-N2)-methyltransferase